MWTRLRSYYVANVRFGGEVHDVTSFIQPDAYAVGLLAEQLARGVSDPVLACWDWVARAIRYPPTTRGGEPNDFFVMSGFGGTVVRRSGPDFWLYPAEVIDNIGVGDCEDTTFLLCSMLRHLNIPVRAAVGIAELPEGRRGHAWVVTEQGLILETTLDSLPPDPYGQAAQKARDQSYDPYILVTESEVLDSGRDLLDRRLRASAASIRRMWGCQP